MTSQPSIKPGDALPPFVVASVSPDAMRDWSGFLADPNPIHLDVTVVQAKGLGDKRINQGPINVAYLMNMLMTAFPGCRIETMNTRFLDNVYEGDRVVASGEVTTSWQDGVNPNGTAAGAAQVKLCKERHKAACHQFWRNQ